MKPRAPTRAAPSGLVETDPDRRMRLLVGPRPDVDPARVEEAALVAERAVVAGEGLEDEVDRLPLALVGVDRVGVGGRNLVGHAAHEADLDAAVREDVGERHLLGDAHRLAAVGDRIAEDQQPRLAGDARERGQQQRAGRIDAGRRLMMLVEHDLEAFLFRDLPFLDEAVEQRRALLRVVVAVGQVDAHRLVSARVGQVRDRRFR